MKPNKIENKLPIDFYKFLKKVDPLGRLNSMQSTLKARRSIQLDAAREGRLPDWLGTQPAHEEWFAPLPTWMFDQRNQMTGPADNEKLVVQLINSGSPGVMLDIEDSVANTPDAILRSHKNVKLALNGEAYYYKSIGKNSAAIQVRSKPKENGSVIFVRVRGLHMDQFIPTQQKTSVRLSASLFDLVMHFYDMDLDTLAHPPCIYIPKSESAVEGLWWKKAFGKIEKAKGWETGTIKAMALVESHPMAFQMEEFAFNLQPYLVGLNLGRWDYMASLIDFMYLEKDWLFPDRNSIPSDIAFFQNLRHWMAHVCHKHGMLAIGGMSAMYPDRKDKKRNKIAQIKLKKDKENEAACLMDGAWTGHPDQNDIAVDAFPHPNQLHKMPGLTELPDLRESFKDLPITEEGTREAIRTAIRYRQAVVEGKGAKLIDGLMEDLATDRICRVMIAQRIDRGMHTEKDVWIMFNEECFRLDNDYVRGTEETINLVDSRQFNPR